jgi:hypothetical protein
VAVVAVEAAALPRRGGKNDQKEALFKSLPRAGSRKRCPAPQSSPSCIEDYTVAGATTASRVLKI